MARFAILAVVALVATSSAQTLKTEDGNVNLRTRRNGKLTIEQDTTIDVLEYGDRLSKLEADFDTYATKDEAKTAAFEATLNATATVFEAVTNAQLKMKEFQQELMDELSEELKTFKTEMSEYIGTTTKNLGLSVNGTIENTIVNVTSAMSEIDSLGAELADNIADGFKCGVNGYAYHPDQEKCVTAASINLAAVKAGTCSVKGAIVFDSNSNSVRVCDGRNYVQSTPKSETTPAISHRGFANNDGRESGWVNERYLQFTKTTDDTYIRVTYYDNMRVHGHGSCQANWNVYICDTNGNDCQECTDPGRLMLHKYSHQQHNYWMNDHTAHTLHGICRKRGNKLITAGRYRLRVLINNNRCDIYTGHNGQYGSLMVQEVYKA